MGNNRKTLKTAYGERRRSVSQQDLKSVSPIWTIESKHVFSTPDTTDYTSAWGLHSLRPMFAGGSDSSYPALTIILW